MVRCEYRVIYGDTDQMGVVYYANYLRLFEFGRTEFLRAKGLSYTEFESREKLMLPVSEAGVSYLQPARYDDLVGIEVSLVQLKRASARFHYAIRRGEDLLATGFTVHACVDATGRICRLPKHFHDGIQAGEDVSWKP
ncbi:MAG TPA: thioesterase family protein [Anaeromyxobacteraceae bacterium]|nr:thioesterase family protein [Anaeromyxobacteraceae bacterium]